MPANTDHCFAFESTYHLDRGKNNHKGDWYCLFQLYESPMTCLGKKWVNFIGSRTAVDQVCESNLWKGCTLSMFTQAISAVSSTTKGTILLFLITFLAKFRINLPERNNAVLYVLGVYFQVWLANVIKRSLTSPTCTVYWNNVSWTWTCDILRSVKSYDWRSWGQCTCICIDSASWRNQASRDTSQRDTWDCVMSVKWWDVNYVHVCRAIAVLAATDQGLHPALLSSFIYQPHFLVLEIFMRGEG